MESEAKKLAKRPNLEPSEVVEQIPLACSDETAAVEFMERQRWGDTPACVHCGSVEVYQMMNAKSGGRSKRSLWRCRDCKRQFTVRIGTVFEDSRLPLRHWCYAFWRASTSKKGVAALEIMRHCQISYKSALFLMHRVRFAMAPDPTCAPKLLGGTVEADECYVGGKRRNKGNNKRGHGTKKQPVFAVVERGGDVRTKVIADITGATLKGAVREFVDAQARILTDENSSYIGLAPEFAGGHDTVNHGKREYARGDVNTNLVEGSSRSSSGA